MSTELDASLADEELMELDAFLISGDDSEERLSLDEAHGFLTGLIVGHQSVPEPEWMTAIWGQPRFADEAEKERLVGWLRRLYQEISESLERRERFEPLFVELEDDGEVIEAYEGWCFGFMLAVSRDEERWETLPKDEQDLLAPIAKLALLHEEEDVEMDDEEYEMLVDLLPGSVIGLYSYWEEQAG